MKRTWANPPAVVVISGTDAFLCQREVSKAVHAAQSMGRRVVSDVSGSEELSGVLSGSVMFSGSVLCLVQSDMVAKILKSGKVGAGTWQETDVDLIGQHHAASDNDVCLVLVHEGECTEQSLAGRVLATNKKIDQINYEAPKPWDMQEYAVKFFRSELKRRGKVISDELANAVVNTVSVTDFGLLSYEAMKYSMYMDSLSPPQTEVSVAAVRGLVAAFGASDSRSLVDAVGNRNLRQVVKAMQEVRDGPAASAGVIVVTRTLGTTAVGWLQVAVLQERGMSDSDIAARLDWKPGRLRMVAPIAARWKVSGLQKLLANMTKVDKDSRHGAVAPWAQFEAALLDAVISQ